MGGLVSSQPTVRIFLCIQKRGLENSGKPDCTDERERKRRFCSSRTSFAKANQITPFILLCVYLHCWLTQSTHPCIVTEVTLRVLTLRVNPSTLLRENAVYPTVIKSYMC